MNIRSNRSSNSILCCLFVGAFCSASLAPFMGYFIVEELGEEPWKISVYSALVSVTTMAGNRFFGERIDNGARIQALVLTATICSLVAIVILNIQPSYIVLVTVISLLFGIANTATATMYGFGRLYAERNGQDTSRYNSHLRIMTSLGWMLGPPLTFFVASQWGSISVFRGSAAIAACWLACSWLALPSDFRARKSRTEQEVDANYEGFNGPLWLAATVCFLFGLAHVLCTASLPLYYTRDVGLPTYAPGVSLAIKCSVEVVSISLSPWLMNRLGQRGALHLASLVGILAFGVLYNASSFAWLAVGASLEGLYYGTFAAVGMTFVQGFARGKIGRATALYMNSLFLGSMAGTTGMGVVATFYGFRAVIVAAAICMVAASAILFLTRPTDHLLSAR